ncbi:MAG: hypothetical protein SGARI_006339 [Bacillariaceae sp.]
MDKDKIGSSVDISSLMDEIKSFVDQYMTLREVEKKYLQEGGKAYSGKHLRQAVLQDAPLSAPASNSRYTGGAKERAREKLENGEADDDDMAVLQGHKCAYCGGNLSTASRRKGVESTYCSRECAEQGRLKRGGMYSSSQLRSQLFALEGGVSERLNALCNAGWKLPKTAKSLERLLQDPKEGDFWQADHEVAVAEGGGGCNLDNLRTLCVPCHAVETEKLHKRLKLSGKRGNKDSVEDLSAAKRQTDIRSMFSVKK